MGLKPNAKAQIFAPPQCIFQLILSFILPLTLRRFLELQCFHAKEECVEEVTKKNSKSYGVGIWRASGSFAAIIIESLSVQESFK